MTQMPVNPRRLYIDCDGVLADFDGHYESIFGVMAANVKDRIRAQASGMLAPPTVSSIFWRDVREAVPDFFSTMPVLESGLTLIQYARKWRPIILTGAPMGGGWAEHQKCMWARQYFPDIPIVTCMSHEKQRFCAPGDVLVDDRVKYRAEWEAAGGAFVHHNHLKLGTIVDELERLL